MSLFEDPLFQYQETYFLFFEKSKAPKASAIREAIEKLGSRFDLENLTEQDDVFEAMTVTSEHDFAGMDVIYVEGEEVQAQIAELQEKFKTTTVTKDEIDKLAILPRCDARFDIFHFERLSGDAEEILDPGALLKVLGALGKLTGGIAIDEQTPSLM